MKAYGEDVRARHARFEVSHVRVSPRRSRPAKAGIKNVAIAVIDGITTHYEVVGSANLC